MTLLVRLFFFLLFFLIHSCLSGDDDEDVSQADWVYFVELFDNICQSFSLFSTIHCWRHSHVWWFVPIVCVHVFANEVRSQRLVNARGRSVRRSFPVSRYLHDQCFISHKSFSRWSYHHHYRRLYAHAWINSSSMCSCLILFFRFESILFDFYWRHQQLAEWTAASVEQLLADDEAVQSYVPRG